MRVVIAFVALLASVALGGCSHPNQAAYARPLELPHLIRTSRISPPPLPVRKLRVLAEASEQKPLPVRKHSEATNVQSAKPPPLPLKKPPLEQSLTPPKAGPTASDLASKPPAVVGQGTDVKFEAAQAKAQRDGVETLTQKDIEGLSLQQIKQLRGY